MNKYHPLAWQAPKDFASTHCVKCKAGWTRTADSGKPLTICLLDREPVLAGMKDCDRYEPREKEAPAARVNSQPETRLQGRNSEASSPPSTATTGQELPPRDKAVRRQP